MELRILANIPVSANEIIESLHEIKPTAVGEMLKELIRIEDDWYLDYEIVVFLLDRIAKNMASTIELDIKELDDEDHQYIPEIVDLANKIGEYYRKQKGSN